MPYLEYIKDEELKLATKEVLTIATDAADKADQKLYSNVVDPFSALFDSARQSIPVSQWLEQEKARQIQKTLQNAVGDFHQAVLGYVDNWRDLKVGGVIDLINDDLKIIAEVKNKYNTTKGNHKKSIYDDLATLLKSSHRDYTGYYVEIIRKTKMPYDKPFTPSDNTTQTRRPKNESIRIIDGRSFYALVTGRENALDELYKALPDVIGDIVKMDVLKINGNSIFEELFKRAYKDS